MNAKDDSELGVLSILHYVWSGLVAVSSVAILAYFVFLAAVFGIAQASPKHPGGHAGELAIILAIVGIVTFVLCVPFVVMHVLAARGLKERSRSTLILVMAALACLSFPLGTALGIWTFIVMMRPSVKALFQAQRAERIPNTWSDAKYEGSAS